MPNHAATISFVVPAYNVERYLDECLESIVQACSEGDQILLVNDGSTDGTLALCTAWHAKLPQLIHLIDQTNQGLSAARNNALRNAKNEFVLFMDSDDVVIPDAVAQARGLLTSHQPEVLVMDFVWWYPHDSGHCVRSPRCCHPARTLLLNRPTFLSETYQDSLLSACNRFFKRDLIEQLGPEVFPLGKSYEEIATVPRLTMRSKSLIYLDEPLFKYRIRAGSITQSKTRKHCLDLASAMTTANHELADCGLDASTRMAADMACARYLAKALQDCAAVDGANTRLFTEVFQLGLTALTNPLDQVIDALNRSGWHSNKKAAKHLKQINAHPSTYVGSRMILQAWRSARRRWAPGSSEKKV